MRREEHNRALPRELIGVRAMTLGRSWRNLRSYGRLPVLLCYVALLSYKCINSSSSEISVLWTGTDRRRIPAHPLGIVNGYVASGYAHRVIC